MRDSSSSFQLGFSMFGLPQWFDGDVAKAIALVQRAEALGVDYVSVADHVIMGGAVEKYPYGDFPVAPDYPWYEPLSMLAAIAACTSRIRLLTAILIAPLRPAVFLAKQIATVDQISGGRLEVGVGVGWQEEEYDAVGLPFEGRFGRLIDQVRCWRRLWQEAPVDFADRVTRFENMYSLPFPRQGGALPVWFGFAPTERNIARMVELADGWLPVHQGNVEEIAKGVHDIRQAYAKAGRDPDGLRVRGMPQPVMVAGKPNLAETLKMVPDFVNAGVTHIEVTPARWCSSAEEFEPFIAEVLSTLRPSARG